MSSVIGWIRTRPKPRPLLLPLCRGRGLCALALTSRSAMMMRLTPPSPCQHNPACPALFRKCVPLPTNPRYTATLSQTSRTQMLERSASSVRRTRNTSQHTVSPTLPKTSAQTTRAIHPPRVLDRKPSSNRAWSPPRHNKMCRWCWVTGDRQSGLCLNAHRSGLKVNLCNK